MSAKLNSVDIEFTLVDDDSTEDYAVPQDFTAKFGRQGRILAVKARLDATNDNWTSGSIYIVDHSDSPLVSAVPDDLDVVYTSSDPASWTGHATTADLQDNLANVGGGYYTLNRANPTTEKLTIGAIRAAGSGAWTMHVLVSVEVFD